MQSEKQRFSNQSLYPTAAQPRAVFAGPTHGTMGKGITYKTAKDVSARAILSLFRRNDWREWYTLDDTKYLVDRALLAATAWHGRQAVGIAVLWGDGRFYARLDTLLVDEGYRRQGIGTSLMELVVARLAELSPHYCEHDVHEEWLVRFYERFGFQRDEGPWLVHGPTGERLGAYVEKMRRRLKGKEHC